MIHELYFEPRAFPRTQTIRIRISRNASISITISQWYAVRRKQGHSGRLIERVNWCVTDFAMILSYVPCANAGTDIFIRSLCPRKCPPSIRNNLKPQITINPAQLQPDLNPSLSQRVVYLNTITSRELSLIRPNSELLSRKINGLSRLPRSLDLS